MVTWSLAKVQDIEKGETRPHIREIYINDAGKPYAYMDAWLKDIIRFWRDWFRAPVLIYPDDFDAEYFLGETRDIKTLEGS